MYPDSANITTKQGGQRRDSHPIREQSYNPPTRQRRDNPPTRQQRDNPPTRLQRDLVPLHTPPKVPQTSPKAHVKTTACDRGTAGTAKSGKPVWVKDAFNLLPYICSYIESSPVPRVLQLINFSKKI